MACEVRRSELVTFCSAALQRAGMQPADAEPTAQALVDATCRGIATHGVFRLRQYVRELNDGRYNLVPNVRVIHQTAVSAVVDADGGLGFRPGMLAAQVAAEIAADSGMAAVAVRNSHHLGAAGRYVRHVAEAGLIAFLTTTTSPTLAPPSGSRPVVGNNPMAYGFPREPGHEPMVVDVALSLIARGHVRTAASRGERVPLSWGFDVNGEPTEDPVAILDGGFLAAIGGHKGYALAVAMEILAGVAVDAPFGLSANNHADPRGGVGHFMLALRPNLFAPWETYLANLQRLEADIRSAAGGDELDPHSGLVLPGEREERQAAASAQMVRLMPHVVDALCAVGDSVGLDLFFADGEPVRRS